MSAHIPTAHEVETFSGRYVDTKNPQPDTIDLSDIAHALAATCRFGGHCRRFYSVAEHAVFVSRRLERKGYSRSVQLAGLHHDDSEAFLGDIPRPMKKLLGMAYVRLTERMDAAILEGLHLQMSPEELHSSWIKNADNWALFVEARHLLPSKGELWWQGAQNADAWGLDDMPSRIITPDYWYDGLVPTAAKALYWNRHHELIGGTS